MSGAFYNQTNVTNFILEIPDSKLTEAFKLNVQTADLPGVSIPITTVPAQGQGISTGAAPGSGIEFTPVSVEFIVDENFESWLQMYKWMISINNYIDRSKSGWMHDDKPRLVLLHVLNNAKNDVIMTFKLLGTWCSDLEPISFDYSAQKDPAVKCKATLQYMKLEIESKGVVVKGRVDAALENSAVYDNIKGVHPSRRV